MRYRRVVGLESAVPCDRPSAIPKGRAMGAKAAGLRYERLVAGHLPAAHHGPWYRFIDLNGPGYCQPDLVWHRPGGIWVADCKLTWTPYVIAQLGELYVPVLRLAHGRRVRPFIIAKNLTAETPLSSIVGSVAEAIVSPHPFPVVHWIGRGPLD